MFKNTYGGKFITFDGPNGVGKSTIIKLVEKLLLQNGYKVLTTKEPTSTELGDFTRNISESIISNSLACLVAADRYEHLSKEIIPALKEGRIVLCDRYILSSLILQCMDNVTSEFVLSINDNIILPDVQFAITALPEIIEKRLKERDSLTRFEHNTNQELYYMNKGIELLRDYNIKIHQIENTNDISIVANKIFNLIINS